MRGVLQNIVNIQLIKRRGSTYTCGVIVDGNGLRNTAAIVGEFEVYSDACASKPVNATEDKKQK